MTARDRKGVEFAEGASVLWRPPGKDLAWSYRVQRIDGDRVLLYDGATRWAPCSEVLAVFTNILPRGEDEPHIPALDDVDYCNPNDPEGGKR